MSALYLTESDVERLVEMPAAIEILDEALRRFAAGEAENVPRTRAKAEGIVLHSMSAAATYLGMVGWKQYTTTRAGFRFLVGLHRAADGRLAALIEANRLGQIRTGAVTALAVRHLADPGTRQVGLFGAGWQAEGQLAAVAAVRPLNRVVVYSRTPERRRAFALRMAQRLRVEVVPAEQPSAAVCGLPLVITATTSAEPVFDGRDLEEGAMVAAIGSNWLHRAEIDVETVRRARLIVCDSVACCRNEAGDFTAALQQGAFSWSQAVELSDVVSGRQQGRSPESTVLFKSVGMALADLALGAEVLRRAEALGVGQRLPLGA